MGFLEPDGVEVAAAVAAAAVAAVVVGVEIGPETLYRARQDRVGVQMRSVPENSVDLVETCWYPATVAPGAKTPALDTADLFAAVSRKKGQ